MILEKINLCRGLKAGREEQGSRSEDLRSRSCESRESARSSKLWKERRASLKKQKLRGTGIGREEWGNGVCSRDLGMAYGASSVYQSGVIRSDCIFSEAGSQGRLDLADAAVFYFCFLILFLFDFCPGFQKKQNVSG